MRSCMRAGPIKFNDCAECGGNDLCTPEASNVHVTLELL